MSAAASFAAELRDAGLDRPTLAHVLAGGAEGAHGRTADLPEATAAVVRLFVLGATVPVAAAPFDLGTAVDLGTVSIEGDRVTPLLRIVPHDILLLASDLPSDAPRPDHVAAAHPPSLALAQLTVRAPVARALDLGTGNGVQALLLALHARSVVATDVNERALRFTELNAALNGRTNIATRHASFFEPIPDERFGVVACSPPYVISPEAGPLYRDAPLRGDEVGAHLARAVPPLLADDGYATILASWVNDDDPLSWVGDCSALAIRLREETPEQAAAAWDGGERWLAYYAEQRIERISYGALVLHRGSTAWHETLELPNGPSGPAGDQLVRLFEANERPQQVAGRRFTWPADVHHDGRALRQSRGLCLQVELDDEAAAVAAAIGAGEVVAERAEPLARQLVALGFLIPRAGLGNARRPR